MQNNPKCEFPFKKERNLNFDKKKEVQKEFKLNSPKLKYFSGQIKPPPFFHGFILQRDSLPVDNQTKKLV
jgi:hypothetical protein